MMFSPAKAGVMTVISGLRISRALLKHRNDILHTGEVGSTKIRMIRNNDVSEFKFTFPEFGLGSYTSGHTT